MAGHNRAAATGAGAVERLAAWALSIRSEAIPPAALTQAKLLLLDTIGCGLAGLASQPARAVFETVADIGGAPRCSVIGSSVRTSLPNAVLANGLLIRALDLNDYVIDDNGAIGGHPSDNIPVALATAEREEREGRDLLAAIVLGYELYGRCKNAMERRSAWDGTSLSGIVAPVMAGWLMRLDRSALSHAIALSVARSATSAIVRYGEMSAAKSLANALVAQNGVQAAMLARHGVTGPLEVIDHARGMKPVFPNLNVEALVSPFPHDSYVMKSHVKAYPCVGTAQAAVAAALELHRHIGGDAGRIDHIRVVMADTPTVRAHQADRERADPKSHEAADHSFPFLVAVALLDGAFGFAQYEHERWNDPKVRAIMGRIEMAVDPTLTQRAPGSFPCRLEAAGRGGTAQAEVLFPPGFSRGGLKAEAVIAKFQAVTSERIGVQACKRIVDAVTKLDDAVSLAPLAQALRA